MSNIIIIDDDTNLTKLLYKYLKQSGYTPQVSNDASNLDELILSFKPDLIILDLVMPKANGLEVCVKLRRTFHEPIIMLTALNDDIDKVTGLEMGADVYLSKPIKPRLLLAHIRAQLRRNKYFTSNSVILNGGLSINQGAREVRKHGTRIELTTAEFDLLWVLAINKGEPVSREELYKKIYNLDFDGVDRSIDLRVSRLRKKLGNGESNKPYILTIRNSGYQLPYY